MRWVVKTSAVRVSTRDGDRIYGSLEETPSALREQIEKTVAGPRSQTILIANQEAYDHILRGTPGLPAELQKFQPALLRQRAAKPSAVGVHWKRLAIGGFAAIVSLWALWIWALRSGM
jgi:hypothetical protein